MNKHYRPEKQIHTILKNVRKGYEKSKDQLFRIKEYFFVFYHRPICLYTVVILIIFEVFLCNVDKNDKLDKMWMGFLQNSLTSQNVPLS